MARRRCGWFGLVMALFVALATHAQTNEPVDQSEVPLTNIKEIWDVSGAGVSQPKRITTEMIVYYFDPGWQCAWGESLGRPTFLPIADSPIPFRSGQRVALDGYVIPSQVEFLWERTQVTVLEENARPAPVPMSDIKEQFQELSGRFVSMQVVVEGVMPVDINHVQVRTHSGTLLGTVHVLISTNEAPIPFKEGDYVRFNGVFVPQGQSGQIERFDLWVPQASDIEVTGSLSRDPRFTIPLTPIEAITEGRTGHEMIRVEGIVRDFQPGKWVTIWDDTGQVTIESEQLAAVENGDRVDAIGYPYVLGIQNRLRQGTYRVLEKAAEVKTGALVPDKPIRLAARLQVLDLETALKHPSVHLRGVLMWSHTNTPFIYVQDPSGCVRVVNPTWRDGPLPPGTIVTVNGFATQGDYVPVVTNAIVSPSGWRGFEAAQRFTLEQALVRGEDGRWVEMRGFVRDVQSQGALTRIELSTSHGEFQAWTPTSPAVESLPGTIVRITGVCSVIANRRRQLTGIELWSPDPLFIRIDEAEVQDVFSAETRTIENLRQFGSLNEVNRRIKVLGTVVLHRPGRYLYLQDGPDSVFALSRQEDRLAPGDRVEVAGFPGTERGKFLLREVVFHRIARGEEPEPVRLSNLSRVNPELGGLLARADGVLINTLQKGDRVQLLIRSGTAFFEAALEPVDPETAEKFRNLATGSRLALKGVYEVQSDEYGRPGAFVLLLRAWDDIRVLAKPPWWTLPRLLGLLVVVVILSFVSLFWGIEISRKNTQLRHAQRELQVLNKELEAFSYSVSHDLRAPLRSIDGFSRALLEDYADKLDEDGKEDLKSVRAASQRMGQLIDDMLMLAKVTRSEIRQMTFDLSALAGTVARQLQAAEPARKVEIVIQPGLMAKADPRLMRIVFENLLGNAWKFTGRRPDARIEFGDMHVQGRTVYFVRDNGVGFDMAYAKKLFGAFQRLHSVTDFPGTGIGLATVQRIIHRQGGRIWAESAPDQGATFYFTLADNHTASHETQSNTPG